MKPKLDPNKKRLACILSGETAQVLDALVVSTDASTETEVVKNALKFYKYMTDMSREGYRIKLQKGPETFIVGYPLT